MTTFIDNISQWPVNKLLPERFRKNSCVAIQIARAMAEDPHDHEDVAVLAELVGDELIETGNFDENGTYWGCLQPVVRKYLPGGTFMDCRPKNLQQTNGYYGSGYRRRLPTTTQAIRDAIEKFGKPPKKAICRVSRHLGYFENGYAFALGARHRIDWMYIIE